MDINYYIIPAKIEYEKDEQENDTDVIMSISPSVLPSGKWVGDCRDNKNYLIKTPVVIERLIALTDENFDAEISSIGLVPEKAKLWNGGW